MKKEDIEIKKDDSTEIILDKLYVIFSKLFSDAERDKFKLKKSILMDISNGKCFFEFNVAYSSYSIKFREIGRFWIVKCEGMCENKYLSNIYWNTGRYIYSHETGKVFCYSEKDYIDESVLENEEFEIIDELTCNYKEIKEKILKSNKNSFDFTDEQEMVVEKPKFENIIFLKYKVNQKAVRDFDRKLKYLMAKFKITDYSVNKFYLSSYSSSDKDEIFDSYLTIKYVNYDLPVEEYESQLEKDLQALLFAKYDTSLSFKRSFENEDELKKYNDYRKAIHDEYENYLKELNEILLDNDDFPELETLEDNEQKNPLVPKTNKENSLCISF